jgi:hypothetical protein
VQPDSLGQHQIKLVNDAPGAQSVTLAIRLWSLRRGKVLRYKEEDLVLPPGQVLSAGAVPRAYLRRLKRGRTVLELRISTGDSLRSRTLWSPLPPKDQHWRDPKIKVTHLYHHVYAISVARPAKNIFLEHPWLPNTNYFDWVPGSKLIIEFTPTAPANLKPQALLEQLRWLSLYDLMP